jgi:hypothetical protein
LTPLRFRLISAGFVLGAAAHLGSLLVPRFGAAIGVVAPAWRNALFTFIDAAFAIAILRRPPLLIFALALFLVQQLTTKGVLVWQWAMQGRVAWIALGVLAFLIYAVVVVGRERHLLKQGPR